MVNASDTDPRPRRHPDSAYKAIGEEGGLVVLPDRREVKVLNQVGVRIFALIDGSRTVADIVREICSEYEVSEEVAGQDVQAFLDQLGQNGMLAGPDAPGKDGIDVQEARS